jgi:hypothetical protein
MIDECKASVTRYVLNFTENLVVHFLGNLEHRVIHKITK